MLSQNTRSTSPDTSALDHHDESVRIAVRALGDMRNSAPSSFHTPPTLSTSSSSSSNSLPASSTSDDINSPDFVYRVSHLPIVNSALRAYSQGKASSRVVKYGAEMMESSVRAVSRPVIDHLPVNVNQLDEFACRQLDRFGRYHRPSEGEHTLDSDYSDDRGRALVARSAPTTSTRDLSMTPEEPDQRHRPPTWPEVFLPPPPLSPSGSRTPTLHPPDQHDSQQTEQQVAQRSRWQAVLLEAGGLSAALSEESMRRLKYCLQWLQYATAHIDAQILILRDFTATLQPLPSTLPPSSPSHPNSNSHTPTHSSAEPISPARMRTLANVRRDVVNTIRQAVDVISKYAGGALPEPARARVRGFILKLPQKWASAAGVEMPSGGGTPSTATAGASGGGSGGRGAMRGARYQHRRERSTGLDGSPGSSKPVSPMSSPRMARSPLAVHATPPTAGAAMQAAQRVLALATESLDMMRGVTGVVKDSLDRADAWVGRLQTVGLAQRGEGEAQDDSGQPGSSSSVNGGSGAGVFRDEGGISDANRGESGDGPGRVRSGAEEGMTEDPSLQLRSREDTGEGEDEGGSRSYATSSTFSSVPSTPGPPSPGVGPVMGLGGLHLERGGGGAPDEMMDVQGTGEGDEKFKDRNVEMEMDVDDDDDDA